MTDLEDPSRLLDSADVPSGLRDSLRAARADVGSDEQVAQLAARLGDLLGPALPAASGSGAAAATGGAGKLGLGALALLVAGGGAWLLSSPPSAPVSAPPIKTVAVSAATPPAPPPAAPASEPMPSAPAGVEPAPTAPKAKLPEKPRPPAQLSEAELLEQARAASKSDPARTLQRASEHAARFPRGVLVQEREVLAIQALRRLGRDAEADRRAEAFAKAFPGSAFQRKLQR